MSREDFVEYLVERETRKETRPEMLEKAVAIYERDSSMIPDRIRVSFSDGMTAVYCLQPASPAPVFRENVELRTGYPQARKRRRTR